MNKAVKITEYQGRRELKHIEYFCTCGYHVVTKVKGEFKCPTCGNEDIISLDQKYKTKVIHSQPYVVDKGLKHFHIAKDKHRIVFHKDNTISVKSIGKEEFKYDLRTKERVIIKDRETYIADERKIDNFFNRENRTDLISTPENRNLFLFAYQSLSREDYREWTCSMGKGLVRLMNRPKLELIYFSGFTNIEHLKTINSNYWWYKFDATNPQDFFDCPKAVIPILKKINSISRTNIDALKKLFEIIGGNNFKTVFNILEQETELDKLNVSSFCHYFVELYNDYGYKNIEKLTTYASREVKLQQGIDNPSDALMYLRDYNRMMKELNYEPEKYPKSLKKVHDIANMNYKINADKILERQFSERVGDENYANLAFKTKEYSIITPTESNDLVKEGESLSHCVASYVKDVAKGLCKILFLRRTENLNESVVTIEVRGNQIKQVRGRGNRMPNQDEREFVEKWAEKKQLQIQYI